MTETAATTPAELQPSDALGGYTVVRPLGKGAMGAVYEATDDGGNRVALKVLHAHLDADPVARERLRREVDALLRLRHHAVARVLDAELEGETAFIVTELLEGPTLEAEVDNGGPLDAVDLYELADQLAAALDAVHLAGVVHRDLKPSNVMITPSGPMLIDFGIAAAFSAPEGPVEPAAPHEAGSLTMPGLVIGTPGFIAPELLAGAEPTPGTDWWGWAALLAFAGTGRAPFGVRPIDVVLRRSRDGAADLVGLPARTARALSAALQPETVARWAPAMVVRSLKRDADDAQLVAAGGLPATVAMPAEAADTPGATPTADAALPSQPAGTWMPPGVDATQVVPTQTGPIPLGDVKYQPYSTISQEIGEAHLDPTDPNYVPPIPELLVRPAPQRRILTVAALLVPLTVLAASRPGLAVAVFAALLVVSKVVGHAWLGFWDRREKVGGSRPSDVPIAAVKSPLHLLLGLLTSIPQLLLGLLVAFGIWWGGNRLFVSAQAATAVEEAQARPLAYSSILAVAFAGLALMAWFGPGAKTSRIGARLVLRTVAPSSIGAAVVIALSLIGGSVLARPVLLDDTYDIHWAPLPNLIEPDSPTPQDEPEQDEQ